MVVAQAPSLWRQLRRHEVAVDEVAVDGAAVDGAAVAQTRSMDLTLISTVLLFALS